MGCYMSKPDDNVYVTEGKGRNFTYATASCQGWRREQEDAEDCIPEFDDDASLFILCDGHGGSEVAKYTVKHLPNFLKNHPLYKEGKYEQALEQAFIDFDALLRTDEVMNELTKMSYDDKDDQRAAAQAELDGADQNPAENSSEVDRGQIDYPAAPSSSAAGPSTSNGSSSIAEDVDTETLRREAAVPIEELISKYANKEIKNRILSLRQMSHDQSPVIKSKDAADDATNQGASSSSGGSREPQATSSSDAQIDADYLKKGLMSNGAFEMLAEAMKNYNEDDDDEDDSEFEGIEESDSDEEDDDDDGDDEGDDEALDVRNKSKKLLIKKQRKLAGNRGDSSSEDDDDDEDSDDDSGESDDDEEEDAEGEGDESDWADMDEDEDDEDNFNKDALARRIPMMKPGSRIHRPGMDSGCTVVVALTKGNKLYVGSAGDSRCIVIMRDGLCKPMSFDHKPEDLIERRRIQKAGGHVVEGRVNGGLNLSRALGDFTYKNKKLDAKDQMITPCPDVRSIELDPDQVEYIFLACDGIWNSMKNQHVTKYIRKTAPTLKNDLVQICMAVFKFCLATSTDGDGTGCDNMTCILARYKSSNEIESSTTNESDLKAEAIEIDGATTTTTETTSTTDAANGGSKKRTLQEDCDTGSNKRRCLRLLDD